MGTVGRPFPTPFASPPGVGESSAVVNVVWGFANLAAGAALLEVGDHSGTLSVSGFATGLGVLAMGLFVATHFSRHYRGPSA